MTSAGTQAPAGRPATSEAVAAAAELGLDLEGHRSRPLEPELVGATDLVLGMAREHVREVALMDSRALEHTFTLEELVRRAQARPRLGAPLAAWLAALTADRPIEALLGSSADDDVEDPIGRPMRVYRHTIETLDALTEHLTRVMFPAGSV